MFGYSFLSKGFSSYACFSWPYSYLTFMMHKKFEVEISVARKFKSLTLRDIVDCRIISEISWCTAFYGISLWKHLPFEFVDPSLPYRCMPIPRLMYMGILFPWILPHVHDKKLRIISRQLNTVFLSMKNSLKQLSRILIPKCVARQCIINLGTYSGILSRYTLFGIHIIISWWSIQKISFKCPT